MASIHDDARNGTLTAASLKKYLDNDPKSIDLPGGRDNVTPLAAACKGGHLAIVRLLLAQSADPDALSPHDRTPLFFATSRSPTRNRAAIVAVLLDAGADIDACSYDDDLYTPLMNAIAQTRDKDVIIELVDRGASLTMENANKETAQKLAEGTAFQDLLIPRENKKWHRKELIELIVSIVVYIIAYVNSGILGDVVKGITSKLYGISGMKDEKVARVIREQESKQVPRKRPNAVQEKLRNRPQELPQTKSTIVEVSVDTQDVTQASEGDQTSQIQDIPISDTVEEFVDNIDAYVADTGLEKFFARGDPFLQNLARKAAALRDDPTTDLGSPENIKRLTVLSLYQPVIYCDDSGSMSKDNRFSNQRELVSRMAQISTKILPDEYGVELRFINSKSGSNLSAAGIDDAMNAVVPDGGTAIGTVLRRKILEPLVYNIIDDPSKRLERPLLVSTITDGSPSGEQQDTLKNAIVECRRKLVNAGYDPTAVTFSISQIGNDRRAAAFLEALKSDREIEDTLYCTTDQLDSKFQELRANERGLEVWLLQTLTRPIMERDQA